MSYQELLHISYPTHHPRPQRDFLSLNGLKFRSVPLVYTDGIAGDAFLETEEDVARFARTFHVIASSALSQAQSKKLIQEAAKAAWQEGIRMDLTRGTCSKSTRSSSSGQCVEVMITDEGVAVRDRHKPAHVYIRDEWAAFIGGVRDGEFDL